MTSVKYSTCPNTLIMWEKLHWPDCADHFQVDTMKWHLCLSSNLPFTVSICESTQKKSILPNSSRVRRSSQTYFWTGWTWRFIAWHFAVAASSELCKINPTASFLHPVCVSTTNQQSEMHNPRAPVYAVNFQPCPEKKERQQDFFFSFIGNQSHR